MTNELVEFLRARLDEDERIARAATLGPWVQSGIGDYGWTVDFGRPGAGVETADSDQGLADADFIAAHNPARVLRDVEARRRMVEECERAVDYDSRGMMSTSEDFLRLLALPYGYHPDYREEWRP